MKKFLPYPFYEAEIAQDAAQRAWELGHTEIWWHSDYVDKEKNEI